MPAAEGLPTMGEYVRNAETGRTEFRTTTRTPSVVFAEMKRAIRNHAGSDTILLAAELVKSVEDHEVVFYQP